MCFSLFVSASLVSANAAVADIGPYHVSIGTSTNTSNGYIGSTIVQMNDGQASIVRSSQSVILSDETMAYATMYIGTASGEYLFRADSAVNVIIENIYCKASISIPALGVTVGYSEAFDPQVSIEYVDGGVDYTVTEKVLVNNDGTSDISFAFTPEQEVSKITITYIFDIGGSNNFIHEGKEATVYITCGEMEADKHFVLKAEQQSEEAGILSGILAKVQGIIDSLTDLPSKIGDAISNAIIEPLKNLFIPSDEFIESYFNRWKELLSDRLGAVWQVVDITFESWEKVGEADQLNTIQIPSVTIPLPDENEFTFGGYEVEIVPKGLEALATACKLITGIVCTFLFINGLRHRYDEVMGVEK